MTLLTVGHGTASQEELTALLQGAGVRLLVDVRTAPGSRRHPHVARAALAEWLPAAGIDYRWEKDLGGFRKAPPDSPDVVWQEPMFRGYAAWTRQEPFRAALDRVLATGPRRGTGAEPAAGDGPAAEATGPAAGDGTVVMCSEAVWWRCHRRLIADVAVLLHDAPVLHLMHDGRLAPHLPTAGARVTPDGLVYDDGALPL